MIQDYVFWNVTYITAFTFRISTALNLSLGLMNSHTIHGKNSTWIIHCDTRKITVCSIKFYDVNSNF